MARHAEGFDWTAPGRTTQVQRKPPRARYTSVRPRPRNDPRILNNMPETARSTRGGRILVGLGALGAAGGIVYGSRRLADRIVPPEEVGKADSPAESGRKTAAGAVAGHLLYSSAYPVNAANKKLFDRSRESWTRPQKRSWGSHVNKVPEGRTAAQWRSSPEFFRAFPKDLPGAGARRVMGWTHHGRTGLATNAALIAAGGTAGYQLSKGVALAEAPTRTRYAAGLLKEPGFVGPIVGIGAAGGAGYLLATRRKRKVAKSQDRDLALAGAGVGAAGAGFGVERRAVARIRAVAGRDEARYGRVKAAHVAASSHQAGVTRQLNTAKKKSMEHARAQAWAAGRGDPVLDYRYPKGSKRVTVHRDNPSGSAERVRRMIESSHGDYAAHNESILKPLLARSAEAKATTAAAKQVRDRTRPIAPVVSRKLLPRRLGAAAAMGGGAALAVGSLAHLESNRPHRPKVAVPAPYRSEKLPPAAPRASRPPLVPARMKMPRSLPVSPDAEPSDAVRRMVTHYPGRAGVSSG